MIIGIDPGLTTGVCVIDDVVSAREFTIVQSGEISWSNRFWFREFFITNSRSLKTIVIEQFKLYEHKAKSQTGSIIPSARMIGIIEAYAYECNLLPLIVFQPASFISARGNYTIQVLHQLPSSDHVRDAYRHIRKYLLDKQLRSK